MKTIVIDPGHGGSDPGAVLGTRYEKNDNLRLGLAVRDRLQAAGQKVVMTRTSDVYVPLLDRSAISNNNNADLFVSLHRNGSVNPLVNGVENFVQINAPLSSFEKAKIVLDELVGAGVQSNRGVKQGDYSVLRYTRAPAQLLEVGFITNETDNLLFDKNFNAYADAIARGILKAVGEPLEPPVPPVQPGGDPTIKSIQQTLNQRYNAGLTVDGFFGPNTKRALVKGVQTELNKQYNANIVADGVFGPKTRAAVPNLRQGVRGNLTYLLQAGLYVNGYHTALDGIFGADTAATVRRFQSANGLNPDGVAGPFTFERIFM